MPDAITPQDPRNVRQILATPDPMECPACESWITHFLGWMGTRPAYRCRDCGGTYTQDMD